MTTTQSPAVPSTSSSGAGRRRSRLARWTGPRTPARLRRIGVVLTLACLVTAVLSLVGGTARAGAVSDVGDRDTALTQDAGEIYRALADADAMATSGYVSAGQEPAAVRTRYDADVTGAGQRLALASRQVSPDDPAAMPLNTLITGLPAYTGLVETARTYNRQGLPLGQSYLAQASTRMRTQLLPAAEALRQAEVAALNTDYRDASSLPVAVVLFGLAVLAGAVDFSRKEYRRTRRRLSPGVVLASLLVVAGVLWWVLATVSTESALAEANKASDATTALDEARTLVLQARSNESLVLVARSGGSASDQGFTDQLTRLTADGGPLASAEGNGADVGEIRSAARTWTAAHQRLRAADDAGRYAEAVQSATGSGGGSSGAAFAALDKTVGAAGAAARSRLADATHDAGSATSLLGFGPAVLFVLAAAGFAIGVARRVEEYR
jgi:hypothetical protein